MKIINKVMTNPVKIPFHQLMRFPGNEVAKEQWRFRWEEWMLEQAKKQNQLNRKQDKS